jgi:hypothetical protein
MHCRIDHDVCRDNARILAANVFPGKAEPASLRRTAHRAFAERRCTPSRWPAVLRQGYAVRSVTRIDQTGANAMAAATHDTKEIQCRKMLST